MSSRIKKSFFFQTKQACLFYYSDLPLDLRILKNGKGQQTQKMGQLVCILTQTGQVFTSKLTSRPHLNPSKEDQWNQNYFKKLFDGMQKFILQEAENNQQQDIELQNQSQSNQKKQTTSKVLLVRDLTFLQEEIYLLRCTLKEAQFHKGRIGINRLWEEFQKYNKFMKREEAAHQKHITELQQRKQQKFAQINQLITEDEKKKNIFREKLTLIYRQKINKFNQLIKGKQHLLSGLMQEINRYEEQSSMMLSDISHSDIVNSQDDRPLTGSLFQPSQSYYYRQKSHEEQKIIQQEN